jgi:hypothetical protein
MSRVHLARHDDIELARSCKVRSTAVLETEPATDDYAERVFLMSMTREPLLQVFASQQRHARQTGGLP